MQPLARDGYTAEQVAALLEGHRLEVTAGLELLDADLNVTADISDDLAGGSVHWSGAAKIHRTCKLNVSRTLPWGAVLARPYLTLADDITARFDVGVFSLVTPERQIGERPETYNVIGYDRLLLLDREVGDSYEAPTGAGVIDEMRAAFFAAGLTGALIDSTAVDAVLPQAMVWPLKSDTGGPTTWLRVLNDLAKAVNYRGFWCDEGGRYRTGPYDDPASRPVEHTFDADSSLTIVGAERSVHEDLWKTPNKWIFVQQNRLTPPTEGDGLYTVDRSGSTTLLGGLAWPKQVVVDVADQASLEAYGDRVVAADTRRTAELTVTTGPFPAAGHYDVFTYTDAAYGSRRVQAVEWELDLGPGDSKWVWQVVP